MSELEQPERNLNESALDASLSVGEWLEQDSQLDSIRGHPRYPAILERVRSK